LHADDVGQQLAPLLLRQLHKGLALRGIGALIDDQQCLGGPGLLQPKGVLRDDDGRDAQPLQIHVIEPAVIHSPGHDGVLAGQIKISVREAWSSPDIAVPGFDIMAAQ
jgi:hypothetical protein